MSALPTSLCDRCRSFRLEQYLEPWSPEHTDYVANHHNPAWMIGTISMESFQADCVLCQNIFSSLDASTDHEPTNTLHLHVAYDRKRIWDEHNQRTVESRMVAFGIGDDRGSQPDMWLFPLRVPSSPNPVQVYKTARKPRSDFAELQVAKEWLLRCRNTHNKIAPWTGCPPCGPRSPTYQISLYVIDCDARKTRPLKIGEKYIALSYVWGVQTSTMQAASGDSLIHLPKTIEDAMLVAKYIGIPHLWVDRYCIDQGNHEEKLRVIRSMELIYGEAELTIIAAGGIDANHGLPGVRGTPRHKPSIVKLDSCDFIVSRDLRREVASSPWSSRGWTYQEALLSSRRLVFTNTQMYFQCTQGHRLEELHDGCDNFFDGYSSMGHHFRVFPESGPGGLAYDIYRRLREYFPKRLSYPSDTIHATTGIFRALEAQSQPEYFVRHIQGVPLVYRRNFSRFNIVAAFLRSLAWSIDYPGGTLQMPMQTHERLEFPSWSWASCMTTAKKNRGMLQWNLADPWSSHLGIEAIFKSIDGNTADTWIICNSNDLLHPSVEIETWIVEGERFREEGTVAIFQGIRNGIVRLDDAMTKPADKVIAVFLGGNGDRRAIEQGQHKIVCLLAQIADAKSQTFRRIGLLVITCPFQADVSNVDLLQQHLQVEIEGGSLRLERRMVCVI